jgi:HPt (histidine-containing phosphotransfer) domain-containing protein
MNEMKPLDPEPLLAAEQTGSGAEGPLLIVDRTDMLARLDGDEELMIELIRLFLAECHQRVAAIKTAIDGRDGPQLAAAAHAMKGAAMNVSTPALAEASRVLEYIGLEGRFEAAADAWKQLLAAAAPAFDALAQLDPTTAGGFGSAP